jgi:hypothetical protein
MREINPQPPKPPAMRPNYKGHFRRRKRHPNHRLVKSHRSYMVDEIARLFGIHKNTVRAWVKAGLPTCDGKRPILILGHELIAFLRARRIRNKKTCLPGEIYCLGCRAPKFPAAGIVEHRPFNGRVVNVRGRCPDCKSLMHRCVSMAKIEQFFEKSDITFPQALPHIGGIDQPTVNSDLRGDVQP